MCVLLQRRFGTPLQNWPRIKLLLNRYKKGYKRKTASIFTLSEIKRALELPYSGPKWIMRKAALAVAYCGCLRAADVRKIEMGNVTIDTEGVWVEFVQSKQRGEETKNRFLVPHQTFGSHIVKYLDLLEKSLPCRPPNSPMFMRATTKGYNDQPMGEKMLRNITKDVARLLGLEKPETYTGHTCRRSGATQAAGAGATSLMLKGQCGWVQEQTAMKYIGVYFYHVIQVDPSQSFGSTEFKSKVVF